VVHKVYLLVADEGSSEVRRRTFAELYADVARLAAAMKSIGIKAGDRVVGQFHVIIYQFITAVERLIFC